MSCDEAQLSNKACAVNPLWFFWAISLFVAFDTCQPFHWRDSKCFFFCHLLSVQSFLDLLKSTEIVSPNVQFWCNGQYFSKFNPIYARLPHYNLFIQCFIHWNINRDNFAWAFDTNQFCKRIVWTEGEKHQLLLVIFGWMQHLPNFCIRLSLSLVSAFFFFFLLPGYMSVAHNLQHTCGTKIATQESSTMKKK